MRRTGIIMAVAAALLSLCSCSGTYMTRKAPSADVTPDVVRLNIDYSQVRCLGEVTVSVSSTVYLGFIRDIKTVNGEDYDFRSVKTTTLAGQKAFRVPRVLRKAAYKVVEQYPEADFYVPAYSVKEKQRMFLGRNETVTMVVKAYKYVQQ